MSSSHTYTSRLWWHGTTAGGYDAYEREHHVEAPPAQAALTLSADAAFLGSETHLNPEQLLLVAASSCQLLAFLARAARARIEVIGYEDRAEAVMDMHDKPARINHIWLRPSIEVAAGTDVDRVRRLVGKAHSECFIANSLNATMEIEATVRHAG